MEVLDFVNDVTIPHLTHTYRVCYNLIMHLHIYLVYQIVLLNLQHLKIIQTVVINFVRFVTLLIQIVFFA